jgi:hypothetical protein
MLPHEEPPRLTVPDVPSDVPEIVTGVPPLVAAPCGAMLLMEGGA